MLSNNKPLIGRIIFYSVVSICVISSSIHSYYDWLNPLDLEEEVDPKQHDGSQPYKAPEQFESNLTNDDGTVRILPLGNPTDTSVDLTEAEKDKLIFDELNKKPGLTDEQFKELTKWLKI